MIRRNAWALILLGMAALFIWALLSGCSGRPEQYKPGHTYDAEDYDGPAQKVVDWDYEDDVWGTRSERYVSGTESYCVSRKNGRCTSTGTRPKYSTRTVPAVIDDADWYLVLEDGTRVDVSKDEQAKHLVGSVYP